MDKKTMILIGTAAVIILVLGIFFLSSKNEKKEEEKQNNNQTIVENNTEQDNNDEELNNEPEIIIPPEEDEEEPETEEKDEETEENKVGNYTLKIYQNSDGQYSIVKENVNDKIAVLINVKNENAKLYDISTTSEYYGDINFVLYYDSTLKLYDVATGTITKFDFNYDTYKLQMSYDRKTVQGIVYSYTEKAENETENTEPENANNDTTINTETQETITTQSKPIYGYYNLQSEKILYENKYEELHAIDGDYIYGTIQASDKEDKDCANGICERSYHLLNVNEEMPLWINKGIYNNIKTKKSDDDYFIVFGYSNNDLTISKIYSSRREEIIEGLENEDWTFDKENNLYAKINNQVYQYNVKGDLVATSESYEKIINIINNYILYVEDDKIYITDFENSFTEEIADYEDYKIYRLYLLNNKNYPNTIRFELEKKSAEEVDEDESDEDEDIEEKELLYIYFDIENNEIIDEN